GRSSLIGRHSRGARPSFDSPEFLTHRPAMPQVRRAPLLLLSLFGAVSLLACNQPPPKAGSGAGDASASVDAEGDAESCKTLASKLCERAGSESSTCASVEKTTELLSPKACAAGLADIEYALARVDEAGKVCT